MLFGNSKTNSMNEAMQEPSDEAILALWRRRKNTAEIAQILKVFEYQVANRLPKVLREAASA